MQIQVQLCYMMHDAMRTCRPVEDICMQDKELKS